MVTFGTIVAVVFGLFSGLFAVLAWRAWQSWEYYIHRSCSMHIFFCLISGAAALMPIGLEMLCAADVYECDYIKYTPQVQSADGLSVQHYKGRSQFEHLKFTWRGSVKSTDALREITAFLTTNEKFRNARITSTRSANEFEKEDGKTIMLVYVDW